MTVLLDSNVLIAFAVEDHVHHEAAVRWLMASEERIATCPVTQGSLIRILVRNGMTGTDARAVLAGIAAHPRHEFWPDDASYVDVGLEGVVGHRQVTDAYLAQLARARGERLVTFDRGVASLHRDVADAVPTS